MSWNTPNYALPGLMPVTSPNENVSMHIPVASLFLEPHVAGDDWIGIDSIGPVLFNGLQPASALASVRMVFEWSDYSGAAVTLSDTPTSGEGTIIIDDADTWDMHIGVVPSSVFDLTPGLWTWKIETTDTAGAIKTLYTGVLEVLEYRLPQ